MKQLDKNNKELTLRLEVSNGSDGAELLLSLYKYQGIVKSDVLYYSVGNRKEDKFIEVRYEYMGEKQFIKDYTDVLKDCNKNGFDFYFSISIYNSEEYQKYRSTDLINLGKTTLINVDVDEGDYTKSPFRPLMKWNSSPNSIQAIYDIGYSKDFKEFEEKVEGLRSVLKESVEIDKIDGCRYLRVPGSYNFKPEHEDENGNYPQVGNVRFCDLQPIEHCPTETSSCNTNTKGEKVPKNVKPISIKNLSKKTGIDVSEIEEIINKDRDEYGKGKGRRYEMIYSLVGDLIGIGCNLRQICRFIEYLYQKKTLWYIHGKFDEEHKNERQRQVFITNAFNEALKKGRKIGDTKVEITVVKKPSEGKDLFAPKKVDMNAKIEKAEYLIDDFLVKKAINLLSGDPGIGKSTYAAYIAALGGAEVGKDYFGEHKLMCNYKSCIINFENSQESNVIMACRGLGIGSEHVYQQFFEDYLDYNSYEDTIKKFIKEEDIDLLIFDPLTNMLDEGISDHKSVTDFMKFLRRLRDELDLTILLITHNVKTSKDSLYLATKDPMALVGGSAGVTRFVEYITLLRRFNEETSYEDEKEYNSRTVSVNREDIKPNELILQKIKSRNSWFVFKYYKLTLTHNKEKLFVEGKKITSVEAFGNGDSNDIKHESAVDETIERITDVLISEEGAVTLKRFKEIIGDKKYRRFTQEFKGKLIEKNVIEVIRGNKKKGELDSIKSLVPLQDLRKSIAQVLYNSGCSDTEEKKEAALSLVKEFIKDKAPIPQNKVVILKEVWESHKELKISKAAMDEVILSLNQDPEIIFIRSMGWTIKMDDYDERSIKELRELANERGIKTKGKTKDILINHLRVWDCNSFNK